MLIYAVWVKCKSYRLLKQVVSLPTPGSGLILAPRVNVSFVICFTKRIT